MRIKEFDILKGIGILLVILGHTGISGLPYIYIYAFHMPLFFFVSGCFYKKYSMAEFFERKAKSLLLPWISFAILYLLTNIVLGYFSFGNFGESVSFYLASLSLLNEDCRSLFRTIWFLVSLFEVSLIYAFLDKLASFAKWCVVSICWILGYLSSGHVDIPLFLDTSLSCVIYYHIGYLFFSSGFYKIVIKKWLPVIAIVLISASIIYLRPEVNLSRNVYPWYLPIISLGYILFLYNLIKRLLYISPAFLVAILIRLGKDSLFLLGFHRFFFIIFEFLFPVYGLTGLLSCFAKIVLVFPLLYIIKHTIDHYFPYFVGKLK